MTSQEVLLEQTIRPPAVAGAFYPAFPSTLQADVESYVARASDVPLAVHVRALVVPHAGYVFSGAVAGTGYRLLSGAGHFTRVVMIGPSHFVRFPGLAVPEADLLETPLGEVRIDRDAVDAVAGSPFVIASAIAHQREHSLEVQLPFLQVALPGVPVVPFLTGDIETDEAADVIETLLDDRTLLLVSSDLSHYEPYDVARKLDAATLDAIVRIDPNALDWESACGRKGIQIALLIARRRGYRAQVLDARNSGDTAGPHDRVVGYASIVIGEPLANGQGTG